MSEDQILVNTEDLKGRADLPRHMRYLPVDERGYVVPWFVAWIGGKPDFRVADTAKWRQAIRGRLCWVCGEKLGAWLAFAVGPMCTITRTITEPPSHRDCAEWSIKHCPFLSNPNMVRRLENRPDEARSPGGLMIGRNPGVTALWITREFETFPDQVGRPLIQMGKPESVTWWREGRPATREEVIDSITTGLPALLEMAKREGPFALESLHQQKEYAERYLPAR